MAFYTATIKDLDKVIDETDRITKSLAGADKEERILLDEALDGLRQVRNSFLAHDHDDDRKRVQADGGPT